MPEHPCPSDLYINRELSWLEFNQRVIEEARLTAHPLLERVKFLAIASSNLDEFVMIRLSGLQQQTNAAPAEESPDGKNSQEQLIEVRARVKSMQEEIGALWHDTLSGALAEQQIYILDYDDLDGEQTLQMREYYELEVFPILTPLAIDPGHPFPHISNLSMNLAIAVLDPVQGERFARMKIPGTLPRLVPCGPPKTGQDGARGGGDGQGKQYFVWLEQVVAANLDTLFPGLDIIESHAFRVTRNADIEIQEDEASDLLRTIEEGLRQRHFGAAARLEFGNGLPQDLRDLLVSNLLINPEDAYELHEPLGLADLMELMKVERSDLKDAPFASRIPPELQHAVEDVDIEAFCGAIRAKDIFLHHPFDSFRPVVALIEAAAQDSNVMAIKQTLYRVGARSPIVRALAQARDEDTQVAVLVELKARFDEENNIEWARALEDAGVHVVYGLLGLKTHCKMALFVRKEAGGLRRYLHLGTGNYNPATARIYTDFSLFTASEDLAADASELFNLLTGYSRQAHYRKLLVAPVNMRDSLVALIRREAEHARVGRPARLIFKMNALVDPDMICELYDASRAGVKIDLIVRGICCLRPGVEGMSESIRVISIVGRFLEHSRAYYFHNGGEGEPLLYCGSADLMQRNLDRRVEVLFPIEDAALRDSIRDEILEINVKDTVKAWELASDGTWCRIQPQSGEPPVNSQQYFLDERVETHESPISEIKFTPASIFPPLPV
jgi:polyphosphate kinase